MGSLCFGQSQGGCTGLTACFGSCHPPFMVAVTCATSLAVPLAVVGTCRDAPHKVHYWVRTYLPCACAGSQAQQSVCCAIQT